MVGGVTTCARAAAIADQSLAGPVGAADHTLEVIDRVLHQRTRVDDRGRAQAGLDRRRHFIDPGKAGPLRLQRGQQAFQRRRDPLVVGDRGGFDQEVQPCRAAEDSLIFICGRQRLRERQSERVAQLRGVGTEVVAQEECRDEGVGRLAGRDRGCGTGCHVRQFGNPGIFQAAIIMRR